ncbi:hypothetical protein FPQ18DRAFT_374180 [Pyronema domesticum]|nr:hypothetical protein FPQ18DRAFT_374180 [Pyronema domesticum]
MTSSATTAPTLLKTHARTLSTYRHALSLAQNQLQQLQSTITALQTQLSETKNDEKFWRNRVEELDRLTRVQQLELTAAKRGRREAEQELARVRVELEEVKRGWTRGTPPGAVPRASPRVSLEASPESYNARAATEECRERRYSRGDEHEEGIHEDMEPEEVVREWVQHTGALQDLTACHCQCKAARAVRGLFQRQRVDKGKGVDRQWEERVERPRTAERERRRLLRERLRATKERVDGRGREEEQWRTALEIGGTTGTGAGMGMGTTLTSQASSTVRPWYGGGGGAGIANMRGAEG